MKIRTFIFRITKTLYFNAPRTCKANTRMRLSHYSPKNKMLVAVDCIIFGFDGNQLNLLLIKRGFEPKKGKWSLMGGFVHKDETIDDAAARVLKELTGS